MRMLRYLDPINKEAVDDVDGGGVVHDGEEEGKKPAQGDHGQDLQLVFEEHVQLRKVLLCQTLKHHCVCVCVCVCT